MYAQYGTIVGLGTDLLNQHPDPEVKRLQVYNPANSPSLPLKSMKGPRHSLRRPQILEEGVRQARALQLRRTSRLPSHRPSRTWSS